MAEEQETFLHRWFEKVWNKGREESIDEMFHAEGNSILGTEAFKNSASRFSQSLFEYPNYG